MRYHSLCRNRPSPVDAPVAAPVAAQDSVLSCSGVIYPMSSGRNFDEVLRALDSIQLTARHNVATPVNWKPGQDVIIPTSVSEDQATQKYPGGWRTLKPYLRVVAQPK